MNKNRLTQLIKYLLFVGIGVGLLYLTFRNQDIAQMLERTRLADIRWMILAYSISLLSHVARAWRWKMLIDPLGHKVSLRTSFYAVMVGYMANFAVPRMGEVVRCGLLNRTDKAPVDKLFGTVILERVIELMFLVLLIGLTYFLQYSFVNELFRESIFNPIMHRLGSNAGIVLFIIGAVFFVATVFLLRFRKKIIAIPIIQRIIVLLKGFIDGLRSVSLLKRPWLFWFLTLIMWVCYFFTAYFLFFILPATSVLGLGAGLAVLVLGTIGVAAPTPGGIGTYHLLVQLTLTLYGIEKTAALDFAFAAHASQMLFLIGMGAISLLLSFIDLPKK